ncbi:MAG TPA: hypothetical protein PKI24_20175, partial [Nitrospira sp.]|nr:hypothetical protein [Nitrospira sp.]HMZ99053.1 hypothetical protein [Nitrospira sp.]HNA47131.1 hypothetical protein [Nitrospira sp.]HNA86547.1 hypothetical protein [Nitrospira sp.]HNE34691.1 hypothetical protein [Nitrospira sp.]
QFRVQRSCGGMPDGWIEVLREGAAAPSFLLADRARSECARPMRAVKADAATPKGNAGGKWREH